MANHPKIIIDPGTLADVAAAKAEAALRGDESARRAAELAERAGLAANLGRLEDARRDLQLATDASDDRGVLFLGFQFFFRTAVAEGVKAEARTAGLAEAERLVRRRLASAEAMPDSPHLGRAHTNLGLVLQYQGAASHAEAESHYRLAIDADRRIGHEEGLARDLGNLGNFYECTGDADRAEPLYLEALTIAQRIGAKAIAAGQLANLGDLEADRGCTDRARSLWSQAAEVFRELGLHGKQTEVKGKLARSAPPA